jgi:hypothetical protein
VGHNPQLSLEYIAWEKGGGYMHMRRRIHATGHTPQVPLEYIAWEKEKVPHREDSVPRTLVKEDSVPRTLVDMSFTT